MTELITNNPSTKNVGSPNLYNRNQQNHQTQQLIQDDRLHRYRARRLRFLINGDKYFQGIHYALNTEKIRSFDSLLNDLTSILSLDHLKLCKGVRVIFDLLGNAITNLADFQDGQSYLCSSKESFIPTDYRLNNNGMLNWLVRNSACISQSGHHNHSLSSGNRNRAQTAQNATPSSKTQTGLNQTINESSNSNNISSRNSRGVSSARNSSNATPKSTTSHQNNGNNSGRRYTTQTSDSQTSTTATATPATINSDINSQHLKNPTGPHSSGRTSARPSRVNNINQTSRASPRTTPNPSQNNATTIPNNSTSMNSKIERQTPKKTLDTNNSLVSKASNKIESIEQQNFSQKSPISGNQSINHNKSNPLIANKTPALPAQKHLGILDPLQSPKRLSRASSPKSRSPLAQADENITRQNYEADTQSPPTQERNSFGPEVMTKYDIGSPIGDGHFSVVYCCMNRSSQELCALKLIDKSKCRGHDDMIYNEVKILTKLSHPNIVKLIEEFDYSDELYLILELVQDGDLFDAISAVTKFSEVHVSTMIHNLSSALTYLHQQGIVHRDIKPENLLISIHEDGSHSLKLADFGLAVELSESQPLYSVCGTAFYVSPEMLSEYGYDYKVDVWSTGVICFILLCGYPPFTSRESENNQDELFDAILAGDFKFDQAYWSKISQHAKNLIKCMLEVDPEKRYTAEQVFTHPWTSGTSSNFNGSDPMNLSRQIASMPS